MIYMDSQYVIGVALGLLGGVLTQAGQLLQKKAVNDIFHAGQERYFRRLIRHPVWLAGLIFGIGGGGIAYVISQSLIGPALVPGLMAIGLIVLAIGSVKLNHESLTPSEIAAIFIMIIGIFFIGFSRLTITTPQVKAALTDARALFRIGTFTGAYFLFFFGARWLAMTLRVYRGVFMAFGNGFLFAQTDFWVNPLIAVILTVLGGKGTPSQVVIFILSSLILSTCGAVVTWQNQLAFRYGQASNIIPVMHVPIQISPIIVYFLVFRLIAPSSSSITFVLVGVFLTIVGGFLLGRRKETFSGENVTEINA